jgi:hypothetical protein
MILGSQSFKSKKIEKEKKIKKTNLAFKQENNFFRKFYQIKKY